MKTRPQFFLDFPILDTHVEFLVSTVKHRGAKAPRQNVTPVAGTRSQYIYVRRCYVLTTKMIEIPTQNTNYYLSNLRQLAIHIYLGCKAIYPRGRIWYSSIGPNQLEACMSYIGRIIMRSERCDDASWASIQSQQEGSRRTM